VRRAAGPRSPDPGAQSDQLVNGDQQVVASTVIDAIIGAR
jgi:hypothetical protein